MSRKPADSINSSMTQVVDPDDFVKKEPNQFALYANQTAFSSGFNDSFGRGISYERRLSGVSNSINNATTMQVQTFANARMNKMGPENGYEKQLPKDLSTRSSRMNRVNDKRT